LHKDIDVAVKINSNEFKKPLIDQNVIGNF